MSGEHPPFLFDDGNRKGSSPRERGALMSLEQMELRDRIIPA